MTWFKVDDQYYDHPKTRELSFAARGLWVTIGSYCAKHLTDGQVSRASLRGLQAPLKLVRELISARVLLEHGTKNARGWHEFYSMNDWKDYQPTRKQVEDGRRNARERKAKSRSGPPSVTQDVTRDSGESGISLTRPDPTSINSPNGELSGPAVADRAPPQRFASEAREAFKYWCHRLGKAKTAKFKGKRKAKVLARLRDGYTLEDIKRAVDGCAGSAWHMGENDRNQRYDDLELICRDGSNLEKFRDMASPPGAGGKFVNTDEIKEEIEVKRYEANIAIQLRRGGEAKRLQAEIRSLEAKLAEANGGTGGGSGQPGRPASAGVGDSSDFGKCGGWQTGEIFSCQAG